MCCLLNPFYTPICSCSHKGLVPRKFSHKKFEKDSNSMTFQQFDSRNLTISCAKSGQKSVVKEMITGSLSLPFSFFLARQLFTCLSLLHLPHSFASFPLPESMEKATLSQSVEYGKCMQNFFYNIHCAHQNCSIACGNCKTNRQEFLSLPVYSVFKQHFIKMASLITQCYCLLLT